MSSYATLADMNLLFGEAELISLTDPHAETPDAAKIDAAIEDASALADSFLREKYAMPLSGVPDILMRSVCDIARYQLHVNEVPAHVKTRYDSRIDWLKKIAAGTASLGLAVDTPAEPPSKILGVVGKPAIPRPVLDRWMRTGA